MTPEIVRAIAKAEAQRQIEAIPNTGTISTTDATATVLFSIDTESYERGLITVWVNALKDDGITGLSAKKTFSYKNDSTTLTVHTEATDYSQSDFTTAGIAANANGITVEIKVTGESATNVLWAGEYTLRNLISAPAL